MTKYTVTHKNDSQPKEVEAYQVYQAIRRQFNKAKAKEQIKNLESGQAVTCGFSTYKKES